MDARLVRQSVADRLKGIHFDLERLTAQAFSGGDTALATDLHEAGIHVDRAVDALEVPA